MNAFDIDPITNTIMNKARTSIYNATKPEPSLPNTDAAVTTWIRYVPWSQVKFLNSNYLIAQSNITLVPVALQTIAKFANKTAGLINSSRKLY